MNRKRTPNSNEQSSTSSVNRPAAASQPSLSITPDGAVVPVWQLVWRRVGPGIGTHAPHAAPVQDAAGGKVAALVH